ncbi:hypothetical protein LUZ60_010713 [Juncus effusus]|nr:hypothetical protein LUZ60_010713 [Juncus effusus]
MAEVIAVEAQRPLMPRELLQAAIEGDEQVLTEMLGLEEGRDGQVNVTIDAGREIEQQNHLQSATFMGNTVLHVLCSNDHDALASKICNKDTSLLKARNKMHETPLHSAAKGRCTRTVRALLQFGAKEMVRERNCHGEAALHEAARHHHQDIINELMTVDPELAYDVDNYGISALEVSLARGNNEMVEILSDQWINARICSSRPDRSNYMENSGNAQNKINMSASVDILRSPPIHLVASVGNTDGAKLLLQKDASLAYLQDSDGLFPIHVAARMGHVEMVILFLSKYLDSGELLDHRGRNFLHIAAEENRINIFTTLFAKSHEYELLAGIILKDTLPPFWEGMFTAMINSVDSKGNTPLHLAAGKGCKLDLQDQIEQYLQNEGPQITSRWFDQFYGSNDTSSPNEEKSTGVFMDKLQIIGLGAVLITTVTFAAAFQLPGGNMASGSPLFGRKYLFKAFILADTFAFVHSFLCTVMLIEIFGFGIWTRSVFGARSD